MVCCYCPLQPERGSVPQMSRLAVVTLRGPGSWCSSRLETFQQGAACAGAVGSCSPLQSQLLLLLLLVAL